MKTPFHQTTGTFDQNGLRVGPAPKMRWSYASPIKPFAFATPETSDESMMSKTTTSPENSLDHTIKREPRSESSDEDVEMSDDPNWSNGSYDEDEENDDSDESMEPRPKRARKA